MGISIVNAKIESFYFLASLQIKTMSHSHHHHHDHAHHAVGNIKVAFFLNLSFTIIEIIGGIWTNSMAILADALHDLGDSIALGLSWYLAKVSQKKRDHKYSYGYKRFSLLAALVNGIVLLIGSIIILIEVLPRLLQPEAVNVHGMIVFALLGIVVNGAAAFRLTKGKTQNERVVMLHLLEDVLGWLAVLIVSIIMLFVDLPILDPLLSLAVSGFILWRVFFSLYTTLSVFLQAVPDTLNVENLEKLISQQENVLSAHDIHLWSMDGEYHVISCHLVVDKHLSYADIVKVKAETRKLLLSHDIKHATIEIEYNCEQCSFVSC